MNGDEIGGPGGPMSAVEPGSAEPDTRNLGLLLDVEVPVSVEVGGARLRLREILELRSGSLVRLDKRADEPVDLRINGTLVARGEVVLIDDCYGLRITQIVDPQQRVRTALR